MSFFGGFTLNKIILEYDMTDSKDYDVVDFVMRNYLEVESEKEEDTKFGGPKTYRLDKQNGGSL